MSDQPSSPTPPDNDRERYAILEQLEDWLELPVIILGFAWLVLLVIELIWSLNPFLNALVYFIWAVFVVDFMLRLFLAPKKQEYLRKNWLTALSLFVPALRIGRAVRVVRALRAVRGLRLVSVVASLNRGMRALRNTMRRRGFGYVMLLTLGVVLVGAAGMYAFERPDELQAVAPAATSANGPQGLENYGQAVWWTAMIITTLGSDYWPQTAEGRLLTLLLSVYGFAVFGYVTATLATFFIGRDVAEPDPDSLMAQPAPGSAQAQPAPDSVQAELAALREEIRALREELKR